MHVSTLVGVRYAVVPSRFAWRALAARAARAPLGGEREVALACLLAARLVRDALQPNRLSIAARTKRAAGARTWLGSTALPVGVRSAIGRLANETASDGAELGHALRAVLEVAGSYLDASSKTELDRLADLATT